MPVVEELIRTEQDGTISFGNYKLGQKSKKSDFEYQGDIYKVKTYNEITKLERNEMFVYESVPGTVAEHFKVTDDSIEFEVEGDKDAQITVQLENDTDYEVYVDGAAVGSMKTNMSGKLSVSVELEEGTSVKVKAVKRAYKIWQKQRQLHFSAKNADMSHPNGWDSVPPAGHGTLW